jgi:response regulator RpfG family c-di-GMP phosphodiesterase
MARILVCDDEDAIAQLLRRYLTAKGYEVETASNAAEALIQLDAKAFDGMLTDLNLTGPDGFDLLRSMRKKGHDLPVLFTTGYPSQETAIKALREGAYDYLVKPFALEEVAERLERAVSLRRLREENVVYARLVSLQAAGRVLAQATRVDGLALESARLATKLLRADDGWFYQGSPGDAAVLALGSRLFPPAENLSHQGELLALSERTLLAGEPLVTEADSPHLGFYLAVPIEIRSTLVGVIVVWRAAPKARFDAVDLEVAVQLAANVGLNLRALGMHRDPVVKAPVEKALSAWADLIGQLVDQHCSDYESKLQRVFSLGCSLIQALDWSHLGEEDWRVLSQVYDLSKLRLPQHMLTKRGPLDDKERSFIKQQVQWAQESLSEVPGMESASQAVEDLHEAYDGSGYPRGKRGHAIDSTARLLAVVDAYVAMTSTRPYRGPLRPREALAAIRGRSGVQFDPEIVMALTSLHEG